MKTCTSCNLNKDLSEFPVRTIKGKTGRRNQCRKCYNEYAKEYAKRNSVTHQARVKRTKRKHAEFVNELKLKNGCSRCGYKKCAAALHYHHLKPKDKEFGITWALKNSLSKERILNEIKKCVILCANCHYEEEYGP